MKHVYLTLFSSTTSGERSSACWRWTRRVPTTRSRQKSPNWRQPTGSFPTCPRGTTTRCRLTCTTTCRRPPSHPTPRRWTTSKSSTTRTTARDCCERLERNAIYVVSFVRVVLFPLSLPPRVALRVATDSRNVRA